MKEMEYLFSLNSMQTPDMWDLLDEGFYNNYHYLIISYGTHPCAYVELPKEHPYYGKDYSELPKGYHQACHGGVTYSSDKGVIFPVEHPFHRDGFWIGWDYNHYGDYNAYLNNYDGKRWTTEEMLEDVKNMISQLKKA